jgi:hypothetical protein
MNHSKRRNANFGLNFIFAIFCVAQCLFDGLLRRDTDLFKKFSHRHVEIFVHLFILLSSAKIKGVYPMIRTICLILTVIAVMLPTMGTTQTTDNPKQVSVFADPEFIESGLFKYLAPRFTLKTQVRLILGEQSDAQVAIAIAVAAGRPIAQRGDVIWAAQLIDGEHPGAERFVDWLQSEVAQNTILAFAPETGDRFVIPEVQDMIEQVVNFTGDAALGLQVAQAQCSRCHVVDDNRMGAIGSTPSFFALRTLADWPQRMSGFYLLNPHPSFTVVQDVTDPFDPNRPPPIVPIKVTLDQIDALLAYMQGLQPADLGAPIKHQ